MRSALRTARTWLADVLIPAPLATAVHLGLVQVGEHEQDGDTDA